MAYRATLKDVAAAAGVSVTTVSLVLNNRPARVSEEKRKAIADAAKKLNYVPNQSARSLVTKQSQLVALIVPDIENLFFAALAKCVEDECAAQGYSLIVANSDDSRAAEHELLQRLPARGAGRLRADRPHEAASDKGIKRDERKSSFERRPVRAGVRGALRPELSVHQADGGRGERPCAAGLAVYRRAGGDEPVRGAGAH